MNRLLILLVILFLIETVHSEGWGRWKKDLPQDYYDSTNFEGSSENVFVSVIEFYQKNVSPVQGSRCPCYPSCSVFVKEAIQEQGLFVGLIMGINRLFYKENKEMKSSFYFLIKGKYGKSKVYDPIEADFIFNDNDWRARYPFVGAKIFEFKF